MNLSQLKAPKHILDLTALTQAYPCGLKKLQQDSKTEFDYTTKPETTSFFPCVSWPNSP